MKRLFLKNPGVKEVVKQTPFIGLVVGFVNIGIALNQGRCMRPINGVIFAETIVADECWPPFIRVTVRGSIQSKLLDNAFMALAAQKWRVHVS